MADSNSLRVMCIFEAGARMKYSSELTCLAAHIYHRFFRIKEQTGLYDLNVFGSAAVQLAHQFFGRKFEGKLFCLVMMDILHGQDLFVDLRTFDKLLHSIELAAKVICTNLDYQINFKDTRWTTPGQLQQQYREQMAARYSAKVPAPCIELESDKSESSTDDEDEGGVTRADRLLSKNDRLLVSSHRYLAHYLKLIKPLVAPEAMEYFVKISNVAWTFMCDCYWSPCVTQIHSSHLACASLMAAVDIYRPLLQKTRGAPEKLALLKTLDKKWNLILCDDLSDNHLKRAMHLIVEQYDEYDRILQHELSTFVIDPTRS